MDSIRKKYQIIVIDPPWQIEKIKKRDGLFFKNKWDVWGDEVESDITL